MVRLALHSIAYEAKTLNLAKAGYTTFYVDDTNGSDAHDGGSWAQAFKTIQYAIDESKPWTKIYVRDGTYSEFLIFGTDDVTLIGESRTGTIISAPSNSGNAIVITADNVHISNIKVVAISPTSSIITSADYTRLTSINFTRWVYLRGNFCIIDDLYSSTHGIAIAGNRNVVTKCLIENAAEGVYISDDLGPSSEFNKIIDNEFRDGTYGVYIEKLIVESEYNTITHNNIIGCSTPAKDGGSNNEWIENYYSSHTTDTNNDGICDTPYTFTGGADYQPVSRRNGWKQSSLPTVCVSNELFIKETKTITLGTGAVPVTETLFTVTGEVECYVVGYIDAAVTSAGALTLEVGIAGNTAGIIAQTAVGALLIDLMWMDATPATLVSKPSEKIIADGADIIHTIATAAATAGTITYYCWWRALSSDGNVVAT